jgi:hypothetical protein
MTKSRRITPLVLALSLVFFFGSCQTIKHDPYNAKNLDELIKRRGLPSYSLIQIVDDSYYPSEYDPDFSQYFTAAELEDSVTVKYAAWIKTHYVLTAWFKKVDEHWIVFHSVEHRGPFLKK